MLTRAMLHPYIRLSVPLSEDEHQFLPNQLALHMDNQSNGGAVELVSNETGQNVSQYFKYNPDKNSVTVSNSTMTADFAIQVPDPKDPNTIKINRINLPFLDVNYIIKYNITGIPYTIYRAINDNIPITLANNTYNGMILDISLPENRELNAGVMVMYLNP
jgi:hypothetical protein